MMHFVANRRLFPLSKMTINFYDFQAKTMLLFGGLVSLYFLRVLYSVRDNPTQEICVLITTNFHFCYSYNNNSVMSAISFITFIYPPRGIQTMNASTKLFEHQNTQSGNRKHSLKNGLQTSVPSQPSDQMKGWIFQRDGLILSLRKRMPGGLDTWSLEDILFLKDVCPAPRWPS